MTIKEIHAKAGSLSDYFGYIFLLFGWYLLNDVHSMPQFQLPGIFDQVLTWVIRLLIAPIVFAIVFGGIHEEQKIQDVFDRSSFLSHIKTHLWRLIGANILSFVFYFVALMIFGLITGFATQNLNNQHVLLGILSMSFSVIELFWFSAIIVERKIFRGLARSIKTLLFNPIALTIAFLWGVSGFADTLAFDFRDGQIPIYINILRSGVFAILRVLATMYILAVYKAIWGSPSENVEGEEAPGGVSIDRTGERLAKASFGLTFVSFVPLLHLAALALGLLAMKRSNRFVLRAAIASWVGGFFTILYVLMTIGFFASRQNHLQMPGYKFLADANTELGPYVELLDQREFQEIQSRLGNTSSSDPDRHWAFDSALALAEYKDHNLDGALHDFYSALRKKPERSEFYFYYGVALLDNDKKDMALDQFRLALDHGPELSIAQQYIDLVQTEFQPTRVTSALMYLIILFILFTLHEYGHAFAAWKLGDNTARDAGRLTLNPIAHLDLFGSILLPGFLLLQNSGTMFGWAKPVPVNPANFKNPNRDHMIVSFAGPAVNLMISMVSLVILVLVLLFIRILWPGTISLNLANPSAPTSIVGTPIAGGITLLIVFLKQLFYTSLILGFFNLLPIPPLDGSWIFAGFLPNGLRIFFDQARQFSFIIFIILVNTPIVDYFLSIPIGFAWIGIEMFASFLGFA